MPNPVHIPDQAMFAEDGQRPNSKASAISHVTQPEPMRGPLNQQLMQTNPDKPVQSEEQGHGRSPGQRWPHMPHVEQFNFDQLTNGTFRDGGLPVVQPLEVQGWSAPTYYQQGAAMKAVFPVPISIGAAPTAPYTAIAEIPGR